MVRIKRELPNLKRSGEFHLAVQFGWVPVLKSVQNFVLAQSKGQKRLDQLIRDEGRSIRRRAELTPPYAHTVYTEDYTAETSFSPYGFSPSLSYWEWSGDGTKKAFGTKRWELKSRVWAVGRFRYLLPPGPRNVTWTRTMRRRLMGSRVTPSTVYNLMPWSWLVDYFTDLGEFVEAVSPGVADRLIADYCYVMQEIVDESTHIQNAWVTPNIDSEFPSELISATSKSRYVSKIRVSGTPFGFGVKQSDLSLHQLGILGALGLSRI